MGGMFLGWNEGGGWIFCYCLQSHRLHTHSNSLDNELSNVKAWLDKHKLTLNTKKTSMIFDSQKWLYKVGPMKIEIGDEEIERVQSFKYLWVYLYEVMTYKEHLSKVVKKLSSRIGVLSKVVRYVKWSNSTKSVLDPIIKLQVEC